MPKSAVALQLDNAQRRITELLQTHNFRKHNRTYNRTTPDGLIQVINLQMGRFDPPGTVQIPGLRENSYGLFTINLGIYVPEVAAHCGGEAKSFVQEYFCCIRARLGNVGPEHKDIWWPVGGGDAVVDDILQRLTRDAFPFLDTYASRDLILSPFEADPEKYSFGGPRRIVCAIIRAKRGEADRARALLAVQMRDTHNPGHPEYVRGLAMRLGLGPLDS